MPKTYFAGKCDSCDQPYDLPEGESFSTCLGCRNKWKETPVQFHHGVYSEPVSQIIDISPQDYTTATFKILQAKIDSGPKKTLPIEIPSSLDFLWLTIIAEGTWEFVLELCTTMGGTDYWASCGKIPVKTYCGFAEAVRPAFINKPSKFRVQAECLSKTGSAQVVARTSNALDQAIKPEMVGFMDWAL